MQSFIGGLRQGILSLLRSHLCIWNASNNGLNSLRLFWAKNNFKLEDCCVNEESFSMATGDQGIEVTKLVTWPKGCLV